MAERLESEGFVSTRLGRLPVLNKRDLFSESVFPILLSDQPAATPNNLMASMDERDCNPTSVSRIGTVRRRRQSTQVAVGKIRATRAPRLGPPNPETACDDEENLQKHYESLFAYLQDIEKEERTEIEHLWNEVYEVTRSQYKSETEFLRQQQPPADRRTTEREDKKKDAASKEMSNAFLDKMKDFARSYYSIYFTRGIQSTSLTPKTLSQLVGALILVDPLLSDDDLTGFVFPVDNVKMTLETVSVEGRVMLYLLLSVKAQCLNEGIEEYMEDYRQCIVDYFYDQDMTFIPEQFQRAVLLIHNAMQLEWGHFPFSRAEFYKYVIQLEAAQSSYHSDCSIQVQYQKGECVGRGKFGTVYRCVNIKNGKFLALKELPLPPTKKGEKQVVSEINMMKLLLHDNVISFYGCKIDREERNVSILMEFCPKSLRNVVDEHNGLSMKLIAHYARQVLQGLVYLHENHIIHRDIKAANVMVTESGTIKVSDFGTALLKAELVEGDQQDECWGRGRTEYWGSAGRGKSEYPRQKTEDLTDTLFEERMQERLRKDRMGAKETGAGLREVSSGADFASGVVAHAGKGVVGTPLFMAPEVLRGLTLSQSSDVWAFGCMMIELVTGRYPWSDEGFESMALPQVMYNIGKTSVPPQIPDGIAVGDKFRDFLSCCLQVDYTKRWTAKKLLEHPFLRKDSRSLLGSTVMAGSVDSNASLDALKMSRTTSTERDSSPRSSIVGQTEEKTGEVLPPALQRSRGESIAQSTVDTATVNTLEARDESILLPFDTAS